MMTRAGKSSGTGSAGRIGGQPDRIEMLTMQELSGLTCDLKIGMRITGVNLSPLADVQNNALLIQNTARTYERIEEILARVDVLPTQVTLEAPIAEVTLEFFPVRPLLQAQAVIQTMLSLVLSACSAVAPLPLRGALRWRRIPALSGSERRGGSPHLWSSDRGED
jgi:hypothetical protein